MSGQRLSDCPARRMGSPARTCTRCISPANIRRSRTIAWRMSRPRGKSTIVLRRTFSTETNPNRSTQVADHVKAGKPAGFSGEDKYPPHPKGPVMMLIVDVVALGEAVQTFKDTPPYLAEKCAIVLCSGQRNPSGDLFEISREFTVSTGAKSKLRP